jgi:hypothetical protein
VEPIDFGGVCVWRAGAPLALDQLSAAGADAALKLILSALPSLFLFLAHIRAVQIDAFALIGFAHTPRRESKIAARAEAETKST